jgi:hypothetical protein
VKRVALLLLVAATAHAEKSDDALKLLDEGINAFQAGKLPEAEHAFTKARDLVPDKPNPHRWLGLVLAREGKCSQAVWELESFIRRVPPSDPRSVEAVTLRDRCKAELKPRFGALVVESTPSVADVRLDDAAGPVVGSTPYRSEAVPAGNHLVFVQKPGFQQAAKGVAITDGAITRVQLQLAPEAAPVAAATTEDAPKKKAPRYWIYGVVGGAVLAVALGVGLGVGLGTQSSGPPTLPAVHGGM